MLLSRQQAVAGPTHNTLNAPSTSPFPLGVASSLIRKGGNSAASKPCRSVVPGDLAQSSVHEWHPASTERHHPGPPALQQLLQVETKLRLAVHACFPIPHNWEEGRLKQNLSPLYQRTVPAAAQPSEPSAGASASQNELASYLQMWAGLGVLLPRPAGSIGTPALLHTDVCKRHCYAHAYPLKVPDQQPNPLLALWPTGVMYVADVAIKAALQSAGIKFPGPLVGMFGVVVALLAVGNQTAEKALAWFGPSLQWIAKWLPLFYVASLVTLPLNLSGIA
eukprot:scaffold86022_cov17-Tisochrysis_lutea.AAC.1